MKLSLPKLNYELNALEPVISKQIMELHYLKHHAGYVNNFNLAIQSPKYDKSTLKFNAGGHINHCLFFENLIPISEYKDPSSVMLNRINDNFGSFDALKEIMIEKGTQLQGSGWVWLCESKKQLLVETTSNQDTVDNPILGIDCWEHAYYLDYKNLRQNYLKSIWKIINWKVCQNRLIKVVK